MTEDERIAYVDFLRGRPLPSMMVGGIQHYVRCPADLALSSEPHNDAAGVLEMDAPAAPPYKLSRGKRALAEDDG